MFNEREKLLTHATRNGWRFDAENGIISNGKKSSIGTKSHSGESILVSYTSDGVAHAISRARAIWLFFKGDIPDGYGVSRISTNLLDDSLGNLVLTTGSDRSKKALVTHGYKQPFKSKRCKLTVDAVNEDRRLVRLDPNTSYDMLAEKRGVRRPAIIAALKGQTFADVEEPPVQIRKPTRWHGRSADVSISEMAKIDEVRDLTIHERDKLFLDYAKSRGLIFDIEQGIIYNRHHIVAGTRGKRNHMLFFMLNKKPHGITRCRAIWLHVHGFVPEGVNPSHVSENRFDDSIGNIELKTLSDRSKRATITKKWSLETRDRSAKMNITVVDMARRMALQTNVSYNDIVKMVEREINQKISKTSIVFAVQGRTFKDATEPPVLKKLIPAKEKAARKKSIRVRTAAQKEARKAKRATAPKTALEKPIHKSSLSEESIRISRSMLRNNPNISNKGIITFLKMRQLVSLSDHKLAEIRREVSSTGSARFMENA